jgi:ApbE superfamily uncharacterized protein (UPF0280 family)
MHQILVMHQTRDYRRWVNNQGLQAYTVTLKESDLHIATSSDLSAKALSLVRRYRSILEEYILTHPYFHASLEPVEVEPDAPTIVLEMARAAQTASVGPMAAVAGAIAQFVGTELSQLSDEVIVENGGDIYLRSLHQRTVAIYAGQSSLSGKIGFRIDAKDTPIGICTSSATVGPSLSFGKTDATVVLAASAILADAAATAIGNAVTTVGEMKNGIRLAQNIPGVIGVVIIKNETMGAWGKINLCQI